MELKNSAERHAGLDPASIIYCDHIFYNVIRSDIKPASFTFYEFIEINNEPKEWL